MSESLVDKLREPVDQGGYDGWYPDPLRMAAAQRIEELVIAHGTEQTMHAAWRKRAEEAELREQVLEAAVATFRQALADGDLEFLGVADEVIEELQEQIDTAEAERDRMRAEVATLRQKRDQDARLLFEVYPLLATLRQALSQIREVAQPSYSEDKCARTLAFIRGIADPALAASGSAGGRVGTTE